ncbi:DeoR/GlpR family transcriptional regulator of sugar metabolism [Microbacterium halimionae]|uniref:Lactose phosphotransferase system repressor n=1 Tax=Microbacterium halimionae TaxID=1526413 RepID=A0A7W3PMU7_9MICO|nr:DeoR/GlpR family DNA-binding transcription regulator [Microbacterium halimionae]MBA8817558.1 DeoR/GlpR family transcriptional regulator of sugar metabolism [Microbacterium halimionae]NII94268.1 DeoR/GlpR family transcriptional regulator of sugar metabolism [Microbacterium halimionae]
MLAASRKELLLDRLRTEGRIVAKDIATELGVSEDSIRRDLRELDAAGLAVRVYGGALPASPAVVNYAARQTVATESKQRIGQYAARLIEPGSTVLIDGGTTALEMVRALPLDTECTIITHSPTVAAALLDHAAEVIILGGRLFKHSAVASGAATAEAAAAISADRFFLGVTGIHEHSGLTTGDPDEAAMKRVLASRASETYVLGSSEKIGAVSRYQVLPLDGVAAVIVESADTASPTLSALAGIGVRLLHAR